MAVSAGGFLAVTCLLLGIIAHYVAVGVVNLVAFFSDIEVSIENPAGPGL